jgi:beta-glucosidase
MTTAAQARFPDTFQWGVATAAYQIEGAAGADGRGPSIWDVFSRTPGAVVGGDTGDVACDHYHRWPEDIALMAELGVEAYRFSIAWPRIQPEGRGAPNTPGLDFYSRLVDGLLAAGITPVATLYHWDLPQALQDRGGWVERDTAGRFTDYAEIVHAALGDRVQRWTTLNEPWCSAFLGYGNGVHAPGITDHRQALQAAHHLLLAHGQAAAALRAGERAGWGTECSITLNLYAIDAASDEEADQDAARRADGLQNRLWLDAVLLGTYPDDVQTIMEDEGATEAIREGDLETIAQPLDNLGVNYYSRHTIRSGPPADTPTEWPGADDIEVVAPPAPRTAMGWGIHPEGLTEVLVRLQREYPPIPLYVTENGAAFDDEVSPDGAVHDPDRVRFLADHIEACADAVAAGVPLRGHFAWSLLDNFEWAEGYAKRFGLVHVDYETQQRRVKDSGRWYADFLRRGGLG